MQLYQTKRRYSDSETHLLEEGVAQQLIRWRSTKQDQNQHQHWSQFEDGLRHDLSSCQTLRAPGNHLRSGCCCRHSWTRLCRVAEWFLGPGLWGRSAGGAVALCVRLPVATLSPMPESTPDRDTFRPPSSPNGNGATSNRQQWEPRNFWSSIWRGRITHWCKLFT